MTKRLDQSELLRRELIKAKRNRVRRVWGAPEDEALRDKVEIAARRCREAGIDISDIVGPAVGRLDG